MAARVVSRKGTDGTIRLSVKCRDDQHAGTTYELSVVTPLPFEKAMRAHLKAAYQRHRDAEHAEPADR